MSSGRGVGDGDRVRALRGRAREESIWRIAPLASALARVGVQDRLIRRPARPRSRRPRAAGGPAPAPGRLPRARRNRLRRLSFPAVAESSESIQRRNCSGGCTPWKLESGCPAAKATTVGTASTPKICATLGATSTLTVASDHLPLSAAARPDSVSASWTQASLRGDHSSTTTGTSFGPEQHFVFEVGLGDLDACGAAGAAACGPAGVPAAAGRAA